MEECWMIIIDLICESFSIKALLILIAIAQLLRIFVVNNVKSKESNEKNRKDNTVKLWMLIVHLIVLISIVISIFKIKEVLYIIQLLCIPFYIAIFIMCFIQIFKNVKRVKKEEFNEFEINSFLYFSYFVLIVFDENNQNVLENFLEVLQNNNQTIFECLVLVLLFLKIFFISFFGLYAILIIIRNMEKIVSKILDKVHFHSKILQNIYFFFTNDDWYFYNFALLNKYKKIKFLIPFLFIMDIIILIVCDIYAFLMYFIKNPIWAIIIIFRYIYRFLNNIKNLNIATFTFKWFRIMIIFSISFEYIILKILKINVSQNIMDIFEIISTVILIPLIFEQLSSNKEKLEK